jgi:hypothetical protein
MDSISSHHDKFFHAVFSDEEHARDLLRNALPNKILRVLELTPLDDPSVAAIHGGAELFQASMEIAKYARTRLRPHLRDFLQAVSSHPMDERYRSFLKVFLEYILQVGRDTPRSFVEEEIEKVSGEDTREVYMTIAEQLRAEGIEIGKREGKIEGKREGNIEGQIVDKQQVLVRLLEKKFGPLDAAVKQKIRSCQDRKRLDKAIDLFVEAESVNQILKPLA